VDEVSGLNPDIQVKMLPVLQTKEFDPVASIRTGKVTFRAIAAPSKK